MLHLALQRLGCCDCLFRALCGLMNAPRTTIHQRFKFWLESSINPSFILFIILLKATIKTILLMSKTNTTVWMYITFLYGKHTYYIISAGKIRYTSYKCLKVVFIEQKSIFLFCIHINSESFNILSGRTFINRINIIPFQILAYFLTYGFH